MAAIEGLREFLQWSQQPDRLFKRIWEEPDPWTAVTAEALVRWVYPAGAGSVPARLYPSVAWDAVAAMFNQVRDLPGQRT